MRILLYFALILNVLYVGKSYCQTRWVNIYHGEIDAVGNYFIETYDNGYLLAGKFGHNAVHFNWLIKTDINGSVLWEKIIGDQNETIMIGWMDKDLLGNTYLAGITSYYDESNDPIIIKLDPCYEKEWCRVYYTPGNYDYSNFVLSTPDGGCVAILRYTGIDLQTDRICLIKLSSEGDMEWKQCYNSLDTSVFNEDAYDIAITPDGGFLITGSCTYEDPNPPHFWWPKSYYIKTDSLGSFEWEKIVHKDISDIGGISMSTVVSPNNQYYYSSLSHYYFNTNISCPALLKMDLQGNVIDIYDVVDGYINGKLSYATFLDDETLAASAGWGNTTDSLWSRAVIIDTMGNILNSFVLMEDIYTSILHVAYDGKLVYMSNSFQNSQFDVYLRKLNQNLEDDTLYTQPINYDTLCPYQITSDTIVQDDCGLIVGVEEVKPEPIIESGLKIFPNPASNTLTISYNNEKYEKPEEIMIFNTYGILVKKIRIPERQNQHTIDISSFPSGLYIAVLRNERKIIAKGKFIIAR